MSTILHDFLRFRRLVLILSRSRWCLAPTHETRGADKLRPRCHQRTINSASFSDGPNFKFNENMQQLALLHFGNDNINLGNVWLYSPLRSPAVFALHYLHHELPACCLLFPISAIQWQTLLVLLLHSAQHAFAVDELLSVKDAILVVWCSSSNTNGVPPADLFYYSVFCNTVNISFIRASFSVLNWQMYACLWWIVKRHGIASVYSVINMCHFYYYIFLSKLLVVYTSGIKMVLPNITWFNAPATHALKHKNLTCEKNILARISKSVRARDSLNKNIQGAL